MQRSSGTIGTIAAALAKAQANLINPEKSMVATIRADAAEIQPLFSRYWILLAGAMGWSRRYSMSSALLFSA